MASYVDQHVSETASATGSGADGSSQLTTSQSVTGPVIGAVFALCAFAVAMIAGLFSGNSATSVVGRALLAMIICYPVGLVAGYICQRVLQQHLLAHADAHPVPDLAEQQDETTGEQYMNHEHAPDEEPIVV